MPERFHLPSPQDPLWGSLEVRSPDNTPDWLLPYERFIEKYCPTLKPWFWMRLQIDWCRDLEPLLPGDHEGVTVHPFLIQLSLRTRWLMFYRKLSHDGVFVLFRQAAYAEFWRASPFIWPLRWLADKPGWAVRAAARAEDLLALWLWNEEHQQQREKPPLV